MARARVVKWNGDAIVRRIEAAELKAVDETLQDCAGSVRSARTGATGAMDTEPARSTGSGVTGRWGLWPEPGGDPFYELFVEVGNAHMAGDNAKRSAIDQHYPKLAGIISRRWKGR